MLNYVTGLNSIALKDRACRPKQSEWQTKRQVKIAKAFTINLNLKDNLSIFRAVI